jgi:hypothetical protein
MVTGETFIRGTRSTIAEVVMHLAIPANARYLELPHGVSIDQARAALAFAGRMIEAADGLTPDQVAALVAPGETREPAVDLPLVRNPAAVCPNGCGQTGAHYCAASPTADEDPPAATGPRAELNRALVAAYAAMVEALDDDAAFDLARHYGELAKRADECSVVLTPARDIEEGLALLERRLKTTRGPG